MICPVCVLFTVKMTVGLLRNITNIVLKTLEDNVSHCNLSLLFRGENEKFFHFHFKNNGHFCFKIS